MPACCRYLHAKNNGYFKNDFPDTGQERFAFLTEWIKRDNRMYPAFGQTQIIKIN